MIKKAILIVFFFIGFVSCKKENVTPKITPIKAVKSYTYNELESLLEKKDGKTYVVNFWATWCAPCVKELPYFEKLNKEYADKNVEVLLVSLDFPKQIEKKLIPFINKNKIQSKVVLLDDVNDDIWMKAIDESWSGALPATIIYNTANRKFYDKPFEYETLKNELKTFLK